MKNLFSVLIILAFLSAGYLLWQNYSTPPVSEEDESPDMGMLVEGSGATDLEVTEEASVSANAPTTASVSYDGSSFSPSPVTKKRWHGDVERRRRRKDVGCVGKAPFAHRL